MPVRKFRSAAEMNQLVWRPAGDPALARVLKSVWEFGRRLGAPAFTPGVRKFRSIEEMKARYAGSRRTSK